MLCLWVLDLMGSGIGRHRLRLQAVRRRHSFVHSFVSGRTRLNCLTLDVDAAADERADRAEDTHHQWFAAHQGRRCSVHHHAGEQSDIAISVRGST